MDALILTCGTGGGHNTAALAVKEALESRGHRVDLLNPYELLGSRAASRINNAYIRTVQRAPWVFGCAYLAGEATGGCRFAPPSIRQTERLKK